jgi:serine protease inhibitor
LDKKPAMRFLTGTSHILIPFPALRLAEARSDRGPSVVALETEPCWIPPSAGARVRAPQRMDWNHGVGRRTVSFLRGMFMMRSLALACAGLIAALAAEQGIAAAADLPGLVQGNTAFAFRLYGELRGQSGNLVFSPYSVSSALAMTRAGARGETARQMDLALGFDPGSANLHDLFHQLNESLESARAQGKIELSVANSLWPQKQNPFLADYLALVKAGYDATITPLDYVREPAAARATINEWVARKTRRKITGIIAPGAVGAATRLVLVNAIYFKGAWARPFREKMTRPSDFHAASGMIVRAPFMRQAADFLYGEDDRLQTLVLPYVGNRLEMVVLLPRAPDGLGALESNLTADKLSGWTSGLGRQRVTVTLPKFKMTASFPLAKPLKSMGLTDAFSSQRADFSGMDGHPHWLFVDSVAHKAFIEVNESGTEAAAATAVIMLETGAPKQPRVFNADHPFLFLIRETATGSILFLGRVTEPEQG